MKKLSILFLFLLCGCIYSQSFTTQNIDIDILDNKTYHVNWVFTDSLVSMEYISPKMIKICKENNIPVLAKYPINKVDKNNISPESKIYYILDENKNIVVRIMLNYVYKTSTYTVVFEMKDHFSNRITKIVYFSK
jgi:diketogulonate reductase-like aldo/keto reductase